MTLEYQNVVGIAIAALGGAAVGLEREWSGHAGGPEAHFAGIRTFTLLGGFAGISGWLWSLGFQPVAIVLLAGAIGLVVAAYVAASRRVIDGTTEVAALVVLSAGILAGTGYLVLASAITAITTLLLVEKSHLHAMIARIDNAGLRAGVRFAVMAVVILPLLPNGPYGPLGGIRPRQLWLFVLLFSGLSFVGYVARRVIGTERGYSIAGLLGGFVSSTAVTFGFARLSRQQSDFSFPLSVGVVAACSVMNLRVLTAAAILRPALAVSLIPYLAAPIVLVAAVHALHDGRDGRLGRAGTIITAVALGVIVAILPYGLAAGTSGGLGPTYPIVSFAADLGMVLFCIGAFRARLLPRALVAAWLPAWVLGGALGPAWGAPLLVAVYAVIAATLPKRVAGLESPRV